MSGCNGDLLYATIDSKIGSLLDPDSPKPSWFERWRRLAPESSKEERLEVYQAIRDSGILPANAGFYLVSWQVDAIASREAETTLEELEERLSAIEAEHGLGEDEAWDPSEAPAEYQEVLRQYHDAWDQVFVTQLEQCGEHAIAALFQADRADYSHRSEDGRQFFFGPLSETPPEDTDWLEWIFDAVCESIEAESPMGPLGLRYRESENSWEIDAYPAPVEVVGGAADGAIISPNFSLDLEHLRSSFERIDDSGWNALGWDQGDGPFVWVEGRFQGREVWLRVLAQAPEGEEPGAKVRIARSDRGKPTHDDEGQ